MDSLYKILEITENDLWLFEINNRRGKIGKLLHLVLSNLPKELETSLGFLNPYLAPIPGFEDERCRGYEITFRNNKKVERFVQSYIPFLVLKKNKNKRLDATI